MADADGVVIKLFGQKQLPAEHESGRHLSPFCFTTRLNQRYNSCIPFVKGRHLQ